MARWATRAKTKVLEFVEDLLEEACDGVPSEDGEEGEDGEFAFGDEVDGGAEEEGDDDGDAFLRDEEDEGDYGALSQGRGRFRARGRGGSAEWRRWGRSRARARPAAEGEVGEERGRGAWGDFIPSHLRF